MNNKYLYGAIIVVIILVGVFFYAKSKDSNKVASDTNSINTQDNLNVNMDENTNSNIYANSNTPANSNTNLTLGQPDASTPEPPPIAPDGSDVAVFQVTYDGTSFSPASVTIKNGDVVVFKNASSDSFRPASDPHPTHTNYPEFDAKQPIAAGGTYQFKFTKSGTWGYHNHLNPSATGTIIVK